MRKAVTASGVGLKALAVVLLALVAFPSGQGAPLSQNVVADLLSRYEKGDWALVAKTAIEFSEVQRQLDRLAPGFLASPEIGPHRARQVLAAFALEVAVAAFLSADLANARKLVEWGCTMLRNQSVADEFDRRWSLASVALLEGTIDPNFLEAHVSHVGKLFPGEVRLLLARAIAGEQRTAPMDTGPISVVAAGNAGRAEADRQRRIDRAIDRFRGLLDHENLAAEVSVRLAHLSLDRNQPDRALAWIETTERQTQDPQLIYLARLFRGQALEGLNQPIAALSAYRGALERGPDAHAATMSLAALLYRQGERAEADRLVSRLLGDTNRRRDPWWTYWMGDWRFFDQSLIAMRELLR